MMSIQREHGKHAPGTPKVFLKNTNNLKGVLKAFHAICSVKIAQFINLSLLVPVA